MSQPRPDRASESGETSNPNPNDSLPTDAAELLRTLPPEHQGLQGIFQAFLRNDVQLANSLRAISGTLADLSSALTLRDRTTNTNNTTSPDTNGKIIKRMSSAFGNVDVTFSDTPETAAKSVKSVTNE